MAGLGNKGQRKGGYLTKGGEFTEPTITITSNGKTFVPMVKAFANWSTFLRGSPGKLTFTMLQEAGFEVTEGAAAALSAEEKNLFYGYVFSTEQDKEGELQVTCYDQIRYLKNKDTYVYENKTAAQLVAMIAADFGLKTGELTPTKYQIPYRIEENATLLDMIENALELTRKNTGEEYVLFDEVGKLCLKNLKDMQVKKGNGVLLLEESSGENYRLTSSIDKNCYNQIKLYENSRKKGQRSFYTAKDGENIAKWGALQYFGAVGNGENGQAKAQNLLRLYNKKSRGLKLINAFGDTDVRAGSLVALRLNAQGEKLNRLMTVERAVHKFGCGEYFMDLILIDKDFSA